VRDPVEREAFAEGMAVVNARGAGQPARALLVYTFADGVSILPPVPNPYDGYSPAGVSDLADIRVHHDWTPLGTWLRVADWFTRTE